MKNRNLRLFLVGVFLVGLASSCAKNYTCPTYVKDTKVEKKEVKG
ncbi:MAG: hypothetical protein ACFB0B_15610 [Thermonemataceae bacterium]